MSWLLKSLQINDADSSSQSPSPELSIPDDASVARGGVKDDLSVLGHTIGRQLRGVAAFLAPPPSPPTSPSTTSTGTEDVGQPPPDSSRSSQALIGIRNDLEEISGSFKSGLSLLSSKKAVSEISKFASSLLPFQNQEEEEEEEEEEDDDDFENDEFDEVPGITQEVLDFVKEISIRPECWTDFPLTVDNDFKMSNAQSEHASAIERLAPSLASLRVNLENYMGDEQFWMIYFILLLPRLNEHDFELLSTPGVIATRDLLLRKLQNKKNKQAENSNSLNTPEESSKVIETELGDTGRAGTEVSQITCVTKLLEIDQEEDTGRWLEEEDLNSSPSTGTLKGLRNEEDVSFSDLEDDENDLSDKLSSHRQSQDIRASPSGSNEWVKLNEGPKTEGSQRKSGKSVSHDKSSEGEESNEWLTVDDDFD